MYYSSYFLFDSLYFLILLAIISSKSISVNFLKLFTSLLFLVYLFIYIFFNVLKNYLFINYKEVIYGGLKWNRTIDLMLIRHAL